MLVIRLSFISCDYEMGKGPSTEDTALNKIRWTLIRQTSHKRGDNHGSSARKKGEWCSDCGADLSCLEVQESFLEEVAQKLRTERGEKRHPGQRNSMEGLWQAGGTERSAQGRACTAGPVG